MYHLEKLCTNKAIKTTIISIIEDSSSKTKSIEAKKS